MINLVNLNPKNAVIKQVNSLLSKRLVDMERQCWENSQYSRRECIEMVGIPNSVNNNELEHKVLIVFQKVGCELSPRDFKACHRLRKNSNSVVVKFSRRKVCEQIMSVKKDLKKLKMQDIGLSGNQSIFINTSLCTYYRMLWSKCKRLYEAGNIRYFYISCDTIKIKITENSSHIAITHTQNFTKYFPEVDSLPTALQNIVALFKCCLCVDLIAGFVRVVKLIVLLQKFARQVPFSGSSYDTETTLLITVRTGFGVV